MSDTVVLAALSVDAHFKTHTHPAVVFLISPLSEWTDWLHGCSAMQPDIIVEINTGNMLRIIHQYINIPGRETQLLPGAITDSTAI